MLLNTHTLLVLKETSGILIIDIQMVHTDDTNPTLVSSYYIIRLAILLTKLEFSLDLQHSVS
jgi:hypothetical protein